VVRVGTPEQDFRVLPALVTGEIMIPDPQGCQPRKGDPPDCGLLRGVVNASHSTGFSSNTSTTWNLVGKFMTDIHCELGYVPGATFGRDNVGLMVQNSGGPTLDNQVVGFLGKTPIFYGVLRSESKSGQFHKLQRSSSILSYDAKE
jgi:hypothetical protein